MRLEKVSGIWIQGGRANQLSTAPATDLPDTGPSSSWMGRRLPGTVCTGAGELVPVSVPDRAPFGYSESSMSSFKTVSVRAEVERVYSRQTGALAAFEVKVDEEQLARAVEEACERLAAEGFHAVAVTPVTSAQGRFHEGANGGSGYGLSFTSAVVITARRASAGSPLGPADAP